MKKEKGHKKQILMSSNILIIKCHPIDSWDIHRDILDDFVFLTKILNRSFRNRCSCLKRLELPLKHKYQKVLYKSAGGLTKKFDSMPISYN